MTNRRAFFVPEVIQTSAMDCGPAALKSLLEGLGIAVDYERLRDACRTGADGTSIDAIEDICVDLGLEAYQEMAALPDALGVLARTTPAIVVVRGPGGAPHFVVLWRVVGPWVQVMDPARGRRWLRGSELVRDLHVHEQAFDEAGLLEWFPGTAWRAFADERLRSLGIDASVGDATTATALAARDGAGRLVETLVRRDALGKTKARALFDALCRDEGQATSTVLPRRLVGISRRDLDGALTVSGCVFLVVRAARTTPADPPRPPSALASRVLGVERKSPLAVLFAHVSRAGTRMLWLVLALTALVALTSVLEMFLLRAAFNAQSMLSLPAQRFWGTAMYAAVVLLLLVLETSLSSHVARLGRSLELRCRMAIQIKLPRLADKYFRTRPMSDVTQRSQGLFMLRGLPALLVSLTKLCLDLAITTTALLFLHPHGAGFIVGALVLGLSTPLLTLRYRGQLEHRVQAHSSALSQLYLDVLLGLSPLRTHGGQGAVRAQQDQHLVAWREESERAVSVLSLSEGLQSFGTLLAVCAILGSFVRGGGAPGALLVVAFWALKLPLQARALSTGIQRAPTTLASVSRLTEPLTAAETKPYADASEATMVQRDRPGIAIDVRNAKVVLGTHEVLSSFSVYVRPGQHIAIVGRSGAGKSSLVAALLGLVELDEGEIRVDGLPIDRYDLGRFRRETVWVDPAVQLWNRSLVDNLLFGNPKEARGALGPAIEGTELTSVLERLARGMATPLGESGSRVSGGEGQRVRLARAMLRRGARLVLLDEAFRGLERAMRARLSFDIRKELRKATVIEVTHDVSDTATFDRILVVEDGRLVEDGRPEELLRDPSSRYRALYDADVEAQAVLWGGPEWKRLHVGDGHVRTIEGVPAGPDADPRTERDSRA